MHPTFHTKVCQPQHIIKFQYTTISSEKLPIALDTMNKICSFCRACFAQPMNWQRLRYYCMK
jgi:hypothetical protein